jgi:[protein-PII] uridylyltransferase
VRLIRDHCHLIDAKFRADLRARSLFMEILRQPRHVNRALRRMNRYGVLGAYIPEFSHIIGRMQYDLFHVYTVDQHTLFVIRNLRRFYTHEFADEFPHCCELIQQIPKPELLYIAGLFHDIAKGRGGDHSELGARDAEYFCRHHGLGEFDTRLVVWLVRQHLLMSVTAQKKDIQDLDVVHEFANQIHDKLHLDYLYLLTSADIRATNPKLWNSWRAALLRELYEATRRALRRGLDNPMDKEERIREVQAEACAQLHGRKGIEPQRILQVWEGFSEDYFLRYSVAEIVWHTRAILKKADDGRALVLAQLNTARGGTELFIYLRDSGGIFATTSAALDRLGLTVLDARIITSSSGYTLDSFTVMENTGEPITERSRIREIVTALRQQLNQGDTRIRISSRQPARALRYFPTPTEINFIQDTLNNRTLLELTTSDQPGLLCRIGRAFTECNIQLQNAKIATIGARVEDLFHITDAEGNPLNDAEQQHALRTALLKHLVNAD